VHSKTAGDLVYEPEYASEMRYLPSRL